MLLWWKKKHFGGKISITDEVVNFPEVERTSGKALTETMRRHAQSFDAEFLLAEVTGLIMDGDVKTVQSSRGKLRCFGVLLATGAHPRSVGFAGEAEFKGRGVAYCATCDGEFFTLELSSQVQQRIEENLKRGLPAEAFARSTVEFGNEGCYLSLAEVLHINRLGTVFTD